MVPYKCFFGHISLGADPGRGKNRSRGSPPLTTFFLRLESYRMHSNNLEACGMKCCFFWFYSEVKLLTVFDVFLDLVILPYFNAMSIDYYAV